MVNVTKSLEFPYFVALTGSIACGSIVGKCFKINFSYFDSDKASHDCYLPNQLYIKKYWKCMVKI